MEKYIKVRKIGEGSFGVAFLARTKDNGKQVVLKEINMNKVCFLIDFTVENHKFQCYCHLLMLEMQTSRPLLNTLESLNLINLPSEQLCSHTIGYISLTQLLLKPINIPLRLLPS